MPEPESATKESFRAELERLVANFAANEAELTAPGYTEMQARTQYITPFFRALGVPTLDEKAFAKLVR